VALGLSKDAAPISDYHELQPGQKVGVMINSIASVVVGKAGKSTSPYAFQAEMMEDLEKGELYAIAVSSAMMSYYIHTHPGTGLKLAYAFDGEPDLHWQVSVGLRKSDKALVETINAVLDQLIADGTLAAIYQRYGIELRVPSRS
jgi:polar amino acid transport system substrate-binding protein